MRRLHLFLFAVLALATQRSFAQTCGPAWHSGLFTHNGPGVDGWILTTTLYDDGNGLKVFAGGQYNTIGGVSAGGAAVWDGQSWPPLGEGVDGQILASTVLDDGSGPALYIARRFSTAGRSPVRRRTAVERNRRLVEEYGLLETNMAKMEAWYYRLAGRPGEAGIHGSGES